MTATNMTIATPDDLEPALAARAAAAKVYADTCANVYLALCAVKRGDADAHDRYRVEMQACTLAGERLATAQVSVDCARAAVAKAERFVCPHCGFSASGCEPGDCPNTVAPEDGCEYAIRCENAGDELSDMEPGEERREAFAARERAIRARGLSPCGTCAMCAPAPAPWEAHTFVDMFFGPERLRIITDIVHASGARLHADGWRAGADYRVFAHVYGVTMQGNADRLVGVLEAAGFIVELTPIAGDRAARFLRLAVRA